MIKILVYITDTKERILSGDSLVLHMPNNEERQETLFTLSEMLHADVMQMKNGDHLLLAKAD